MAVSIFNNRQGGVDSATAHLNQTGDEVIMDFTPAHTYGTNRPNGLTGIRIKTKVGAGVGLNAFISIAPIRSFETLQVAAWITPLQMFINDPIQNLDTSKRLYCRNETQSQVRACSYDASNKKVTLTEAFGRESLPTDVISFDYNEDLSAQPKTEAGTTASVLRLNDAGDAYVHQNYDIEIQLGTTRHARRVTTKTTTRVERPGSATYRASAVDTANNTITIGTDADYRTLESASTVYIAATGGYSGWSVGDILELRVTGGSTRKFTVWTESGTQISFDGSGTPANVQMKLTDAVQAFTLDRALPSVPPNDTNVYVVSGSNFNRTHALVETSTAATTTVIPITSGTWDTAVSSAHDVLIDNQHRDVSAVNNTARTITLSTALSAIPNPGDFVHVGTLDTDYEELTAVKHSSGSAATKEVTIDYPFSHLKFAAVGGASNTNCYVQVAGANIPDLVQRVT